MSDKLTDNEISLLRLIALIRKAVGDPHGTLTRNELVEHCRAIYMDSARLDWIEKNKVSLLYALLWWKPDREYAWIVQAEGHAVPNIANAPKMRRAIDQALANNPEVKKIKQEENQ